MTSTGSYDKQYSHRDTDAEIQRLAAQARQGWAKESRTLEWFGLRDGLSVLELGSGPGFITGQLLELLPTSRMTCLEVDPALLWQAEQYLGDEGRRRVTFVEASVMATGLDENQFDIAYARFLFQHLADPIGAAREIRRVLKPGGKLIVLDIDDELFGIFHPTIPELAPIVAAFGRAQAARGGNRHIGRNLWRILQAAGFHNLDLEIIASHSDAIGVEPFLKQLDPDRLTSLVTSGLLAEQTLEQYRESHARFSDSADAYALWVSMLVCGAKP